MKRRVVFSILMLGICSFVFSQSSSVIFTASNVEVSSLNEAQKLRYDKMINQQDVTESMIINVEDLATTQNSGKLKVHLPWSDCDTVLFSAQQVSYISENEYTWYGVISKEDDSTVCNCNEGSIMLIAKNGHKYGYVSVENDNYEYWDLTGGLNMLLRTQNDSTNDCESSIGHDLSSPNPLAEKTTACCKIRTLVLYTCSAEGLFIDVQDKATLAVEQTNQAYRNSDISDCDATMELIDIKLINFSEGNNIFTDLKILAGDSFIQQLRGQYNADMVVIFTGKNYAGGAVGKVLSGIENVDRDSCFAIVDIEHATRGGRYTFTHETGHLLGGHHQQGASYFPYPNARGHMIYQNLCGQKLSIMHTGVTNTKTRVLHYSNPDVIFKGHGTGTSDRNVAAQIKSAACTVADFFPEPSDPTPPYQSPYQVLLSGPSKLCPCAGTTISANFVGMQAPYTYEWYSSIDGINWQLETNGTTNNSSSSFFVIAPCDDGDFISLKLTVTDANSQIVTSTKTIIAGMVVNGCGGNRYINPTISQSAISLFPNPSSREMQVKLHLISDEAVKIGVIDMSGRKLLTVHDNTLSKGDYIFTISQSQIGVGIFNASIQIGNSISIQKFILN